MLDLEFNPLTGSFDFVSSGVNYSVKETEGQSLPNGGILEIDPEKENLFLTVQGDGGPVTLSATPFGNLEFIGGKTYLVMGLSNTNTVKIISSDVAKGCILNGDRTLSRWHILKLIYLKDQDRFVEVSYNA